MSKADNLKILRNSGINVPPFTVVHSAKSIDLSFSNSQLFSVRSSFSIEDGENASFAGQFDTFLNVERNNVADAVVKVLNSYKAETYMTEKFFGSKNQTSEVIIQEMICADYSGVMFTANPLGILNETVIVVGNGLGINVVEDKINTTTYYFNRDDNQFFFNSGEDTPRLSSKLLSELLDNAVKIQEIFEKPVDIEFAIKDDALYILQTRPITALNNKVDIILDNSNIVESYPGRTLPLTQDFAKEIYYRVFKSCVDRVSGNTKLSDSIDDSLRKMVDTADGSLYYHITNWYALLKLLPFSKKIIAIWQNMLGVSNKSVPEGGIQVGVGTKATISLRFLYYLLKTPTLMTQLNDYFEKQFPLFQNQAEKADSTSSLLELYHELIEVISSKWDITLINDMYAFLFTALSGKKHKDELADIKDLQSMAPVIELNKLTETARKFSLNSVEYTEQKMQYIEAYGDRCLEELKLETKSYRTNPELLDKYIADAQKNELPIFDREIKINRNSFFVRRAKLGISNREISRMNRSRLFGLARGIMLKIGDIMQSSGLLDEKTDVFYLYENELSDKTDRRQLVASRKKEYENFQNIPVFGRLVFSDKIINHSVFSTECGVVDGSTELTGTPAATGCAEGEVAVITSPSLDIDVSGKIIVTVSTDPGWIFLIKNSIGIIAEKGSLLSHTAIITRELGKPAIVNVKFATQKLKTGDRVSMDAENGIIKIISKVNDT